MLKMAAVVVIVSASILIMENGTMTIMVMWEMASLIRLKRIYNF
jgi:hypothetical protein